MKNYPEKYWHCYLKLSTANDKKDYSIVNDLTFAELTNQIIEPWLQSSSFTIGGKIVKSTDQVSDIKITYTESPQSVYKDNYNAMMENSRIADFATDRKMLPIRQGIDYTNELLFSSKKISQSSPDLCLVETICTRLPYTARILANRSRKDKNSYIIKDEFDVQDLLHAVIRAFIKYSVQEDPLNKVAGTKSSKADISIEDLGILIEVKYVYGPDDQKRIFEEFSQDLILYPKWERLKTLLYVIYNSADLRDPEAL